ncbi:MAG: class II fructose-bisphosphate aldolase [Planctomycetota bacterium]|nr:class II fructose-bisphosphate aldolase [Planctomycetota bacterium]
MPVANYKQYCQMLDSAQRGHYAYPAANVTSEVTANAALWGFAQQKSDGIVQVSTGGGEFASGQGIKDSVLGAISIAEHIHRVAGRYNIYVAIHTDHCMPEKLNSFFVPLVEESERRVAAGGMPLFNSHMFDGSGIEDELDKDGKHITGSGLKKNMDLAVPLLERMSKIGQIIEVEAGVVGGEEDGAAGSDDTPSAKLYTTPEDMAYVYKRLSEVAGARYMFAATFGNVHGSYKPGVVKLQPGILRDGQARLKKDFGKDAHFDLVFHGGSGSSLEEIHETLNYGVVKMNVDTDMQYAFSRAIAGHFFTHYEGVLKIDGEVGNKKLYDPRAYLKLAETAMANRTKEACDALRSTGKTLFKA